MKQQTRKKKKKPQRPSRLAAAAPPNPCQNEAVFPLIEAFESISFREAATDSKQLNGDINKAAEILSDDADGSVSSGFSGSDATSSSGSTSSTCSGGHNKHKRAVAVTGTVSSVIGKDYVMSSPRRDSSKPKEELLTVDAKEQFLCSLLSDDCELSMAVVKDVLCQCGYDVEKALDVILDLCASSYEQSADVRYLNNLVSYKDDAAFLVDQNDHVIDSASDCPSHSAEGDVHESIWGYDLRNHSQVITSSEPPSSTSRSNESDLPQIVLKSLFNIPRSSKHEPATLNWRNVAKKLQMLGPAVDACSSSDAVPQQGSYAKGAEYHLFRQSAKQHWDSMRLYYQKAAVAYSKGERQYASYLSDQGKAQSKLAQKADERASKGIFVARNKDFENVITIDLHGQHVKEAMRLLKFHLQFGTYLRSVQILKVITGCGNHGLGKSKLKESIITLLEEEGIRWSEENRGTLLIKLDGFKEYSFLDLDTDTE